MNLRPRPDRRSSSSRDEVRDFADTSSRPRAYEYDTQRELPLRDRRADGGDGAVRSAVPRGVRRPGRRLRRPVPRDRGSSAASTSRSRSRSRPGVEPRRDAGVPLRHRGAEAGAGCPTCSPGTALAGFGLTEPEAGSDAGATRDHRAARRRRVGHQRHRSSSSPTPAPTSRGSSPSPRSPARARRSQGDLDASSCPSGTPGFTVEPAYDKVGWHASDTHPLHVPGRPRARGATCSASGAAASRTSSTPSTRAASRSPRSRTGAARGLPRGGDATTRRSATCSASRSSTRQRIRS